MTITLDDLKGTFLEVKCQDAGQCENATRPCIAKKVKKHYIPERGGKEKK